MTLRAWRQAHPVGSLFAGHGRGGKEEFGTNKCAPPPPLFLQEYHSRAFNFANLQGYHSKRLRGCLFAGVIFGEDAHSKGVASIYRVGSGNESLHSGVIYAKSIIPKELRILFALESAVIAQEYHSLGLSIAMRLRIVEGEMGPGRRDSGLMTARSCAKFEHVLFYRTSKANQCKMAEPWTCIAGYDSVELST